MKFSMKLFVCLSFLTLPFFSYAQEHRLQITAINFLQGGFDNAGVKNKIITVNKEDENKKIVISKNSKMELSIISNHGTITYQALSDGKPASVQGEAKPIILGETKDMIRYWPTNDYGFSYLMVEEVTEFTEEDLNVANIAREIQAKERAEYLKKHLEGLERVGSKANQQ